MARPKGSLNKKTLEGRRVNTMSTEDRIRILANLMLDVALESIEREKHSAARTENNQ